MADGKQSELHRAFDDLNEGLRSLLGMARTKPHFVAALLDRPAEDQQPRDDFRRRGLPASRGATPGAARRARRSWRPRKNHLSLVK